MFAKGASLSGLPRSFGHGYRGPPHRNARPGIANIPVAVVATKNNPERPWQLIR
jgi:hypothetical protein